MWNQDAYNRTDSTTPARVGRVVEVGSKYTLETPEGTQIKAVGGWGRFRYQVDTYVTYVRIGHEYMIVQVAPHGF